MLAEVRRTIRREGMLRTGEPLWVAVSGGVDSMVLLHVLQAMGHPCSVAHVDHGLRGPESDADRHFVEMTAERLGLPFRSVRVDLRDPGTGTSLQMAARDLRYAWFKELLREGPAVLALGHHRDDVVETLLLGLLRGIGARGWGGVPPVTTVAEGRFIRPLLAVGRQPIMAYAAQQGVAFREDASNADAKYLRNRVRHELLPLMEDLRPGARQALARASTLLREIGRAAHMQVDAEVRELAPADQGTFRIPIVRLLASPAPRLLLARLLPDGHTHPDLVDQLLEAMANGSTGAGFQVGPYRLTLERDVLSCQLPSDGFPSFSLALPLVDRGVIGPFHWQRCTPGDVKLGEGMATAWLDLDLLEFPLLLRPWQQGDRMRPIGLGGSKLISDILIDDRVPAGSKPGKYVLVSGQRVVWLEGHRLAESCSPGPATQSVLRLARIAP